MPKEMSHQSNESEDTTFTPPQYTITQRVACLIARKPWHWLLSSVATCAVLTAVAGGAGNISISAGTFGWESRGTLIGKRQMQSSLVQKFKDDLFFDEYTNLTRQDEASPWDYLVNNIVMGHERFSAYDTNEDIQGPETSNSTRFLEQDSSCNTTYYFSGDFLFDNNLYAIWGSTEDIEDSTFSLLDPQNLLAVCEAEMNTYQILEDGGLCGGCDNDTECLPPFSLLYFLRKNLGGLDMSCPDLIESYTPLQDIFTDTLIDCTNEIRFNFGEYEYYDENWDYDQHCNGFGLNFVDTDFGVDGNRLLRYSSSYFPTAQKSDWMDLYNIRGDFDAGNSPLFIGVYDTAYADFNEQYEGEAMLMDVLYASISCLVAFLAMILHTKSPWIACMGLAQILFSVTVSFFVYQFICGLTFFPLLNLIGLFVATALGADYLFVATDKWKNARSNHPKGSSEDIAMIALPDAAGAMFLTTSTTAVAFFATCICPVTPIFTFAVFCGLMIVFNYVLNCALIFPTLCIYDRWLLNGRHNCFVTLSSFERKKMEAHQDGQEQDEPQMGDVDSDGTGQPLIHHALSKFYNFLHSYRWVILTIAVAAMGVSAYLSSTISRPQQNSVRLLPKNDPTERHFEWSQQLLAFNLLIKEKGANVRAFWGIIPADNGDHADPETRSNIVLDENFDPSSIEAQAYLVQFCDKLFENDFAERKDDYSMCEINAFDDWLQEQSIAEIKDEGYLDTCNSADSLPMAEDKFHACIIYWSKLYNAKNILSKDGVVKIIRLDFRSPIIQYDQPISLLGDEWKKFEDFFEMEASTAPSGVNQMFQTSPVWWWYDTSNQMLSTAFGAAGITLGFSAALVLVATRSLVLTFIAVVSIAFVLTAATATLVLIGWELGFLESVCFAILIGISCDFVIHFGHAYTHLTGNRPKEERTKHSLVHMGPSIIGAAATSISAALIMFLCSGRFFIQFAQMLVLTMLYSVMGSFVLYFVLTDIMGPTNPSKSFNAFLSKCYSK